MLRQKLVLVVSLILSLATIGCARANNPTTESAVTAQAMTIRLNPANNSQVSGTAMLIPRGNQTEVLISVNGEPSGASEPAHIHDGQCGSTLGAIAYPLHNVEGGRSMTLVNAPLSSVADGRHAINVHESARNIGTTVACGNLPRP